MLTWEKSYEGICHSMVDQMFQNSTKQFFAFSKRTILIQRIIYIFNERNNFVNELIIYSMK